MLQILPSCVLDRLFRALCIKGRSRELCVVVDLQHGRTFRSTSYLRRSSSKRVDVLSVTTQTLTQ